MDRIEELQKKLAKASTPSEYLKIAKEIGIENLDDDQKQIVTMLETVEGISKGLLKAGKDFVKGIFDFVTHPVKTIESTMDAIAHPIETYDYLSKFIADSFQRDVINGDAKSRAEWISYALGTLGLSVVGTKGLGAVTKTGMTTVKATAKVGVRKVKGAAKKIPTLNLYPYAPQHQLVGVNAGVVPYNTVNSVGLRDQLISMAKVEVRGTGKGKDTLKVKFAKEQLATKPLYAPVPEKWIKKGVTMKIDEDGTWVYTNKKGQTVRYPDGYPDFAEYSHPTIKPVEIEIASPTNRPLDYKNANIKARLNKDSDPPVASLNEAPEGYTWHHHQDGKTMILVDKKVHREFTHAGGVSIVNGK